MSLDGADPRVGLENVARMDAGASASRKIEEGRFASADRPPPLLNQPSQRGAEGTVLLSAPVPVQKCPWGEQGCS